MVLLLSKPEATLSNFFDHEGRLGRIDEAYGNLFGEVKNS